MQSVQMGIVKGVLKFSALQMISSAHWKSIHIIVELVKLSNSSGQPANPMFAVCASTENIEYGLTAGRTAFPQLAQLVFALWL